MSKILKGVKLNRSKPLDLKTFSPNAPIGTKTAAMKIDKKVNNCLSRPSEDHGQVLIEDALKRSVKIIENAEEKAQSVLENAQIEGKEIRTQAYKEGFDAGKKEGYNIGLEQAKEKYSKKWEEHLAYLYKLQQDLDKENRQLIQELENESLKIALKVSEKILKASIDTDLETYLHIIERGLQYAGKKDNVNIRLSPTDYRKLQDFEGLDSLYKHVKDFTLIHDPFLAEGDCVIEAAHFTADVGISTQVENIKAELREMGILKYE